MSTVTPFTFVAAATRVEFGEGTVRRLGDAVRSVGRRRAFVVTDRALASTPVVAEVVDGLRAARIDVELFDGVTPNPTVAVIDEAGAALRRFGDAAVVPVGGGSSLDAAKGVALVAANDAGAGDFDFSVEPAHPAAPVVAVPTTAGTGSETNSWGVIDDPVRRRKVYLGHASAAPRVCVLDPLLTLGLPPRATAATGFDALVHGIESLTSRGRDPLSETYAHRAVRLATRWLPVAVADGENVEARAAMLLAAHLAGLALTRSGLGLVHGLAHAVSAHTGAVHGEALAAVLEQVMEFNLPAAEAAYAEAAVDMATAAHTTPPAEAARAAITAASTLADEIGVRHSLSALGVTAAMRDSITHTTLTDPVTTNTPRPASEADLKALLAEAH